MWFAYITMMLLITTIQHTGWWWYMFKDDITSQAALFQQMVEKAERIGHLEMKPVRN